MSRDRGSLPERAETHSGSVSEANRAPVPERQSHNPSTPNIGTPNTSIPQPSEEVEKLTAENELLKRVIAWANNSLYGSHGFFLSTNGGDPDEHHLDRKIEVIKEQSRKAYIASLSQSPSIQGVERAEAIEEAARVVDDFGKTWGTAYLSMTNEIAKAVRKLASISSSTSGVDEALAEQVRKSTQSRSK